ncbi:hypothetical protein ACTNDY_06405 [Tissierellaceae bacterium HCP3S3_D8]
MKKKFYLLLIVMISLVLVACGDKDISEVPSNQNPKTDEENVNKVADEDVDAMKTFNVVAGSPKMVKILELLGYENVVGIPSDIEDTIYKDAVEFGPMDNPDYDIVKQVKPKVFLTEASIDYESYPNENNLHLRVWYFPLDTLEGTKDAIKTIGDYLGLSQRAEEVVENLEENI